MYVPAAALIVWALIVLACWLFVTGFLAKSVPARIGLWLGCAALLSGSVAFAVAVFSD